MPSLRLPNSIMIDDREMELKHDLPRYRELLRDSPDGAARSPLLLMVEYLERQLRDFQKSAPQLARRAHLGPNFR